MNINNVGKPWYKRLTFHGLSIQQRLPLLICILLSALILTFSLVSYYGVKKASIEIGKNRLRTLTDELGSNFSKSSLALNKLIMAAVKQDSIKRFILSGGTELEQEATDVLKRLKKDSTWSLIELLDSNRIPLLRLGNEKIEAMLSLDTIFSAVSPVSDSFKVGKTYTAKESMFYPVFCKITDRKKAIGYLIIWRSLSATPQALKELSQLMGTGATLYVGNTDGSLWTNLIKPVKAPPINTLHIHEFFEYTNQNGDRVIAALQPVLTTQWLLLVEFSEQTMLETATRFLSWVIVAGSILIALGIFITWLMSYNIIRPLNQLTTAATAIASGDYSSQVKVNRLDELGKLAFAFNQMAEQIKLTQQHLENKVRERTIQLEASNKELEAFSYSISHDLRSPLRGITGFTSLLEEKYGNQLNDDAKRLLGVITNNTLKMGNLIDDLLAFFRMSRQEIVKSSIATNQLVDEVIADLDIKDNHITWLIQPLPESYSDVTTIRQVWINLISNAVKYSRNSTSPHIEIGSDSNGEQTVFFIRDNGVGFDIKYKDKLFKVFQRLHSAQEFEGTGIGLAIVEKVISKHGGKVWVEAEKNVGATFYFSLPNK